MRQTENKFVIKGKLEENRIKIESGVINGHKCKVAKGEIFLRSNDCSFIVNIYKTSLTSKGEKNQSFDKIVDFLDSAVDEKTDSNIATMVSVTTELNENIYVNKEEKLIKGLRISAPFFNYPKVVELNTNEEAIGRIEGIVKSISPEIVNESETGRLIVTLWTVDYNESANELKFIAPDEADDGQGGTFNLAEAIEQIYNVGDTVIFDYEAVAVGQKKTKKVNAFGRTAQINEGYSTIEYHIIGGRPPFDDDMLDKEGNPLKISDSEIKSLSSERKIKIEQIEKEGYKGGKKSDESHSKKSLNEEKNPFTSKGSNNNNLFDDDDDVPF